MSSMDRVWVNQAIIHNGIRRAVRKLMDYIAAPVIDTFTMTAGTATATTGAATLNAASGKVTSEALTTAQNAIYTLTITNSAIAATDVVLASVDDGTNTQGTPMIGLVSPAAGSVVIEVINKHATAEAFNGTVVVSFLVVKQDT